MTGNSPVSGKNNGQKQSSSNGSNNSGDKIRKVSNGMSLLSMWKIEDSQKSSTDYTDDEEFLPAKNFRATPKKVKASPKKPRISPKKSVCKADSGSQDQEDLEYCPNCQMPFEALIKQSQNWHLTECMDFDFQHLKECPAGEFCSSTIPSHYMKFTHYALARSRSGIHKTPTNSPSSEKLDFSISSEKIKSETPLKQNNSFPKPGDTSASKNVSPRMSDLLKHVSSSCSDLSNELSVSKYACCNTSLNNSAEEKCKQSRSLFSSVPQFFSEHEKSPSQSSGTLSRCSTPRTQSKSTSDCSEFYLEFKTPSSTPIKTFSPAKVTPGALKNCNGVLAPKQCKRMISGMLQSSSSMDEELTCSVTSVSDLTDCAKDVVSGVRKTVKRMKLNDSSSCSNNFLQSDDVTGVSGDLESKLLSRNSTPKRKQLDRVCSKMPGNNDTNINGFQQDTTDIFYLADDWFPHDEFDTADTTERDSRVTDNSKEELFVFKDTSDVNRKIMMQTVLSKTSSTGDSSLNMTLSQVKPEKLTPQKKPKSVLQHRSSGSSGQTEPAVSPRKKQTNLMSFFKSSSSHAVHTQKMTFVEPATKVKNNKPSQNTWTKNFQQSKTFNTEQQGQNNSVQQSKGCPYYKRIPGTTFAVDAFSYGTIPGIQHYFLSHFHYDHYRGLTKNFHHPVYCSVVTANLVSLKIRLPQKYINTLKLNETTVIENVAVTVLDANHCPGSVMFLFGLPDGQFILHTGDFRAAPAMELYPPLRSCSIERLFLDTTYCSPLYDFPSQDSILEMLTSLVVPRMKSNAKLLVVCGSYTIGKEKAFMAIADSIDCKIWAEPWKRRILNCLEDNRISSRLVTAERLAKIHVRPMWMIKVSHLHEYLLKFPGVFNEIIGLKPTGWEHTSSSSKNVFFH